ncbi:MAG: holo-ACP synthase [Candidatus Omnitrophica bacterium]|jgi:holo-[acyl-carrier protein] synthase|nr:holo-ACP synthase [Candidatus Omnitrophota bacterium]MDD5690630.1 holo-ACP synthase [Candidatus Omnitrophota bacterium]
MTFVGTGVDITEVRRIRAAVEKWGNDFLRRIFTDDELKNAKNKNSFYQHLAGRFAAKEAVFKAAGDNSLSWQDIQINNDQTGKPVCLFLNGRGRHINVYISISHVKTYAVASAVVTKEG